MTIYFKNKEIARHSIVYKENKNVYRTNPSHLPSNKQFTKWTYELAIEKASSIGTNVYDVVDRLFKNEKVKMQAVEAVIPILN